jgi:hypothetical protein
VEKKKAIHRFLQIDPEANEFSLVYGSVPENNRQIAMLTRSMLEILVDLSSTIEIPEIHVQENRAPETAIFSDERERGIRPMIQITCSKDKPDDAFVAVPYRRHWFWIDDRDYLSKRIFTFLLISFSLTETDSEKAGPIVTIPAN